MKRHAKDYLIEIIESNDTSNWLKALICETIKTNGELSSIFLDDIFKEIVGTGSVDFVVPSKQNKKEDTATIKLLNLTHIKGVNALSNNQNILFSDDITILHGLNGAGKSGYFKILNEITGGKQHKKIIKNIYKEDSEICDIEVSLKYSLGSDSKEILWAGKERDLYPLNQGKVFDTSYLKGLLEKRESDETLIEPFGLHLFGYIVNNIDVLKERLKSYSQNINNNKPTIDLEGFSDEVKSIFISNQIDSIKRTKLESSYLFTEIDIGRLKVVDESIKNLNQENILDKIKLEQIKKESVDNIIKGLREIFTKLKGISEEIPKALEKYNSCLVKSKDMKAKIKVLEDIPQTNSESWKKFIKAGEEYSKNISQSTETCSYCFQSLQGKSLEIIKSYSEYLSNNCEQELNNAEKKLLNLQSEINTINTEIVITEDVKLILLKFSINETEIENKKDLYTAVLEVITFFGARKNEYLLDLQKKELKANYEFTLDGTGIKEGFESMSSIQVKKLKELSFDNDKKNKQLKELGNERKILIENKNISKQSEEIKKWLKYHDNYVNLLKIEKEVKTNKISLVSSNAHDELLTDNLKNIFETELIEFGLKLNVKLEKEGNTKGKNSTVLSIAKGHSITSILSEGEQKAVALALFISEAKISTINHPVIFDDPINSLDHKIADNFTQRLLNLDNQIIIFNHNKLFIDTFETLKDHHICKDIEGRCCKSKGKHIAVYEVISEGRNSKGVLKNYKKNSLEQNLKELDVLLNKSPFDDVIKASALLRKTIECYIDEKVLNRQVPTKYSNKNSRISWSGLKEINVDEEVITELEKIHSRMSGGLLHNGTENDENPPELEELKESLEKIKTYI